MLSIAFLSLLSHFLLNVVNYVRELILLGLIWTYYLVDLSSNEALVNGTLGEREFMIY